MDENSSTMYNGTDECPDESLIEHSDGDSPILSLVGIPETPFTTVDNSNYQTPLHKISRSASSQQSPLFISKVSEETGFFTPAPTLAGVATPGIHLRPFPIRPFPEDNEPVSVPETHDSSQRHSPSFYTPAPPPPSFSPSPINTEGRRKLHGVHFASQERRNSWTGALNPDMSQGPWDAPTGTTHHPGQQRRRVKSSVSRLAPLVLEGTASKFNRGAVRGRLVKLLNTVRFRGKDTRQLAILVALNTAYSTTELLLGLGLGKIELVSDAFHLSFGCGVLLLSLTAMVWGRQNADENYTYGYGRLEVLAAFTNALFLLFLSFSLSVEALHAFIEDESEHKHYLIISAVANLLVNLLGVFFFRHYAHLQMQYTKPQDMNHHAIFLHLLSDSIRSAGVILASWLLAIGVGSAETICLGLVAGIVLWLTVPLIQASGGLLLQMAPAGISEDALHKCVREASSQEGITEFVDARFWAMVPGAIVGTLTTRIKPEADEQGVLRHIHSVFNDIGVTDLTVQIER